MSTVLLKNEYFKSEKMDDGSTVVSVLNDPNHFFGIDTTGSKLITDKNGFISDLYAEETLHQINLYCKNEDVNMNEYELKMELRCRTLNFFISMV